MADQQTSRTDFNGRGILCSPILWGAILCVTFYVALPVASGNNAATRELFCGHPLAYTATLLFWMGIAGLAIKLVRLPRQATPLKETFQTEDGASAEESVVRIEAQIGMLEDREQTSWAICRLKDLCSFVRSRKSTAGLNAHLQYLADFSGEQLHNSYAFVRTVTWAVPILGFLGTVVGITQAIQHLDPQQLTTSFDLVAKGLSVAFGTTALALGLSLVLVFGAYLVERLERSVLAEIEMLALTWVTDLFPAEAGSSGALANAEAQAAADVMEQTELMIRRQTENWEHAIEQLRSRWTESFERHQTELDSALQTGLDATLTSHSQQLAESREILIEGVRSAGSQIDHSLRLAQEQQQSQLKLVGDSFSQLSSEWQNQLAAQKQLAELWSRLAGGQEQLAEIENKLANNLEVAQAAESLNETLHSLNAAVHLLTARVRPAA